MQPRRLDRMWRLSSPGVLIHCTSTLAEMHTQPSMFHNDTKSGLSIFHVQKKEGLVFGDVSTSCHLVAFFPGSFVCSQML